MKSGQKQQEPIIPVAILKTRSKHWDRLLEAERILQEPIFNITFDSINITFDSINS